MTKKKALVIGGIGLGLIAVGLVVWLFASGRVTVTVGSARLTDSNPVVCTTDTVEQYNIAYDEMFHEVITRQLVDDNIPEGGPDVAKLKVVADDVKKKSGYEKDPTCQTIVFWSAIFNADYEGAKTAHEAVLELHKDRQFADSNIRGDMPISTWEDEVWSLSPEALSQDPARNE